ncbi:MAG: DoxX family protein [Flavobacteriales bacterium]|jgi:hypothetical protein|nr:DoxX family protein [Flavobacteriales bacterium]
MQHLRRLPDIIAAVILLQTLFFKFTGAAESVWIFEKLGAEPVGRIGSGVIELIAAALLIMRTTAWMGALLALGTMAGAILGHLTILGIEVMGDGGTLFALAVTVAVASSWVLMRDRERGMNFVRRLSGRSKPAGA